MSRSRVLTRSLCVFASTAVVAAFLPGALAGAASRDVAATPLGGDFASAQWGLDAVRAREAWAVSRGTGSVVAVIDTGVDATNPDLAGQLVDGAEMRYVGTSAGWVPVEIPASKTKDTYGHGTHVAGIIAAKDDSVGVVGVAPDAKILPVNVWDLLNQARTYKEVYQGLASAVDYAAGRGVGVISMSLGGAGLEKMAGEPSVKGNRALRRAQRIMCSAITRATEGGTLVVIAAGNDGLFFGGANYPGFPASCPDAVSVAAATPNAIPADFSSSDPTVLLAAPGQSILSTVPVKGDPVGQFPYAEMSGTSMATPMVSAAAALLRSAEPDLSPAEVRDRLTATATDMAAVGRDSATGFGMVDAAAALGAAEQRGALAPRPYIPLIARPAMNANRDLFTAAWAPPTGAAAPTSYTLTVQEAFTGEVTGTYEVAGDQVRYTWAPPKDTSVWVMLTAHFAGGSDVQATPRLLSTLYTPDTVEFTGIQIQRTGRVTDISWDPLPPGAGIDTVFVMVEGPGVSPEERMLQLRPDGTLPTSVKVTLSGNDLANTDLVVSFLGTQDVGGGWYLVVAESFKMLKSRSPATFDGLRALRGGEHLTADLRLNARFSRAHCPAPESYLDDLPCEGRSVQVDYRAWVPESGKDSRRGEWVRMAASAVLETQVQYNPQTGSELVAVAHLVVPIPEGATKVWLRASVPYRDGEGRHRSAETIPVRMPLAASG